MIALGSNVRVYLAAGRTDMRCGIGGLNASIERSLSGPLRVAQLHVVFLGLQAEIAEPVPEVGPLIFIDESSRPVAARRTRKNVFNMRKKRRR